MSNIRILSEHLSNQIAAGEVVERPASVVKELVENSVDAGATQIDVQVEGGGLRLLRIADNGNGMIEDDVLLCFERHATSKLREESQLAAIATLGFRGEALPSIGSVSQVTIISRAETREIGTSAVLKYGVLHSVHEDGCSRGTIIEVRNLFGNVPARKKFLKSSRTELFHIEEVIKNQAMAMPEIGFTLTIDNRLVLDYQAGSDLEQRLRQLFKYKGILLSLEHRGAAVDEEISVGGYLLLPESAPARSARLRILVNGRAVYDRVIRNSVVEGLQGFLMKGYQPAGAVFLTLPPHMVDVNVHPAKREIRFFKPQLIQRVVTDVVKQSLQQHQEQARGDLFLSSYQEGQNQAPEEHSHPPLQVADDSQQNVTNWVDIDRVANEPLSAPEEKREKEQARIAPLPSHRETALSSPAVFSLETPQMTEDEHGEDYQGLTLIGQLFSLYLLCEKDDQFIVIDQHAAHERILYGHYKQEYLKKDIPRQQLLFPETVELGPDHVETIERHEQGLQWLGFELQHFGEATWVIKGVPAVISILDPVTVLHEVLDALHDKIEDTEQALAVIVDELLASMACKAAVKAGNKLTSEEMLGLLQQMQKSEIFSHCPHGRPVLKSFSRDDLVKWFHRHGG